MLDRRSLLCALPITAAAVALTPAAAGVAAAAPPAAGASPVPVGPTGQTPIALSTRAAVSGRRLPALVLHYPRAVDVRLRYVSKGGCTTRSSEETVQAEVPAGAASIALGGLRYDLLQFHFHTPSEHTLDGRRFPIEQHFVHQAQDGSLLVIGRFLRGGGRGETPQDQVLRTLPEECGPDVPVPGLDLAGSLPPDLTTLRYSGSLTTSPFTDGVAWLVLPDSRAVLDSTVSRLQALFPAGNARALQPLAGRTVALRRQ